MRLQDSRLWRLRTRLERPRQPVPQDGLSRGYRRPATRIVELFNTCVRNSALIHTLGPSRTKLFRQVWSAPNVTVSAPSAGPATVLYTVTTVQAVAGLIARSLPPLGGSRRRNNHNPDAGKNSGVSICGAIFEGNFFMTLPCIL